jgi:hypothetical protein
MKVDAESCKGFLISCDKNREKQALRDAYNFLTEVLMSLFSKLNRFTATSLRNISTNA